MTARLLRRAEIVAVGSELLGVDRLDTNSLAVTARLHELGIEVAAKAVVGDRLDDLAAVLRQALERADLVVTTGGLGPTDDDVTREAVARVLGRRLVEDARTVERIRARFARRGLEMPEINRRQALVIEGAHLVDNEHGTAPGQWVEVDGRLVVLLPGPPRELEPMLDRVAREVLEPRAGPHRLYRRVVGIVGRTESQAEERLRPLYARWAAQQPPVAATILAGGGQIELHLTTAAADAAEAAGALETAAGDVVDAFGVDVFTTTGEHLEAVVGTLLRDRGLRVAVAESCTGGLVSSRLTDVAGSSAYVERGVVAYSNQAKVDLLGVPEALIAAHGAVSEAVAAAMAAGVRRLARVEVGLGITGIAGPGGGTPAKPVGTVAIAVDGPADAGVVRTLLLPGGRLQVKAFASTSALDLLRRAILRADTHAPVRRG
jgi:nicotinamide-nucleotide amidase